MTPEAFTSVSGKNYREFRHFLHGKQPLEITVVCRAPTLRLLSAGSGAVARSMPISCIDVGSDERITELRKAQMNLQTAYEESPKQFVIHSQDLDADHSLMRGLLNRFESTDEHAVRRSIMQVVVDLFELHSAIELQMFPALDKLSRERDAVYDLMEQVEGTDARSQLHFARGLELIRAFRAYIEHEESLERQAVSLRLQGTNSNSIMLEQRAILVRHAQLLLRLH